jgi:hypothetical protein
MAMEEWSRLAYFLGSRPTLLQRSGRSLGREMVITEPAVVSSIPCTSGTMLGVQPPPARLSHAVRYGS